MKQTVDARVDVVSSWLAILIVLIDMVTKLIIYLREASAGLLVELYRAIQSLKMYDEQTVRLSRFCFIIAKIVSH